MIRICSVWKVCCWLEPFSYHLLLRYMIVLKGWLEIVVILISWVQLDVFLMNCHCVSSNLFVLDSGMYGWREGKGDVIVLAEKNIISSKKIWRALHGHIYCNKPLKPQLYWSQFFTKWKSIHLDAKKLISAQVGGEKKIDFV